MTPKAYSYVRFSTPGQEKGSLQRQLEQAEQWTRNHNMKLDTTLKIDRGLSGYHGTHRTKGALGAFLSSIKQGEITRGSVLLIENMDRLSREKPMTALRQFDDIIRAGIKVITLQSGMEYTEDSINKNQGQLYIIIGEIQRANAESERKSFLIGNARERRRQDLRAGKVKAFSKMVPMWIDKKTLEPIPEIVRAIEYIYDMYLEGKGKTAIMNALNDPESNWWKPPKSKKNPTGGWKHSSINRYLDNDRRLIGECQLYKIVNGKRVKDGEPLPDVFPPVISREKFFRVQEMKKQRAQRAGNAGGHTGKYNNLFRHLVKCGICGSSMIWIDKGDKKGGHRLICTAKQAKAGCIARSIPYEEFESIVRKNFRELDVSTILPGGSEIKKRIREIQNAIDAKNGEIKTEDANIEGLMKYIEDPKITETLRKRYHKRAQAHSASIDKLESEIKDLQSEADTLSNQTRKLQQQFNEVNDFQQLLDQAKSEEQRIEIRQKIHNALQNMIDKIIAVPLLSREEAIKHYKAKLDETRQEIKQKREKGEKIKMGLKIRANSLRRTLEELQEEDHEPGIEYKMDSKNIDRIYLHFKGAGIIEKDEDGEWRVKTRIVRLKRWEFTEEFRP